MSGAYSTLQDLIQLRLQAKDLPLFKAGLSWQVMQGIHRTAFKGRGMNFEEVRTYQFGDDIRSIDWRVTARRMKPHTKVFQEERERPVLVIVDQSQSMFFGSVLNFKSVTAAEAAALISWNTLQHGDRIGGLVFNISTQREIRPKRSKKTLMQWLNHVEQYNRQLNLTPTAGTAMAEGMVQALRHARRIIHPGTLVFVISDFCYLNEQGSYQLAQLARHSELRAIHISDPLEQHLPPPNQYRITDGMHTLTMDTSQASLQQQYQQHYLQRVEALKQQFQQYRTPMMSLTASEPTATQLLRLYGVRGILPNESTALHGMAMGGVQ